MFVLSQAACLAILASLAHATNYTASDIAELEQFWSYGGSEPWYPTPQANGTGSWAEAFEKAKALVANMTNDEKNNMTYGFTTTANGCGGVSGAVESIDFPGLCLSDAGNGLRGTDFVNSYPGGLHVGASWNKELTYKRAYYMGKEFAAKGVNVALGPVVGPVGRISRGGRNWEGFSNDPYLTGSLGGLTVEGLQENVVACVKHLIGNEQETMRNPPLSYSSYNNSVSSNIDDVTMHELYLWPFQDTVKAGAGSMMASYNRINNSYSTQNSKVLNGLLKHELGFQGFVVSDWYAQHTGIASANAGLDMVMPSSDYWIDGNLTQAVENGTVSQDRLDDMVTRILAPWIRFSSPEAVGQGMPYNILEEHEIIDARDPNSKPVIFQGAVEGQVLVKNDDALPLQDIKMLSVFGYDAQAGKFQSFREEMGVLWSMAWSNMLTYPNGTDTSAKSLQQLFLSDLDPLTEGPGVALNGTLFTGGGSGSNTAAYVDAPLDALLREANEQDFLLQWDVASQDPDVQYGTDACLVFINEAASEGWDRPYLADEYSDILVENVASKCDNTIVVIHNAGIRLVDRWYDNDNVTAIIYAHLPGQDSGKAITEILFGRQSPSGRLPYTVAKNESDYGSLLNPTYPQDENVFYPQDNFTEGVYIDYKHFIKEDIEPRFAFGYGLTYSEFDYSDLSVFVYTDVDKDEYPPNQEIVEGGMTSLWDVIATVSVVIENTGNYTAAEVPQLYVGIPGAPEKQLRGYDKMTLIPGESTRVHFDLTRRDLSVWDVEAQMWKLQSGDYNIYVGKSVLDIQLEDTLFV